MPIRFTTVPIEPDRVMKIKVKDLHIASMEITEKGIELEFREIGGKHTGDLIITPIKIIWNKGKKSKTGKAANWPEFFTMMQKR
jgi:hypothetical protein